MRSPAFKIKLRSPYKDDPVTHSWFGGLPKVPHDFRWPRNDKGKPLHFLAQIDLSMMSPAYLPEPEETCLPVEGCLVIFIDDADADSHERGAMSFACVIGSPEMANAAIRPAPDTLPDILDDGSTQSRNLHYAFSFDLERCERRETQDSLEPAKTDPLYWIDTCGLALFEARIVQKLLEQETFHHKGRLEIVENARKFNGERDALIEKGVDYQLPPARKVADFQLRAIDLHERVKPQIDALLNHLEAFKNVLETLNPADPIDKARLVEVLDMRAKLAEEFGPRTNQYRQLMGDYRTVLRELFWAFPGIRQGKDFEKVPMEFRPFIEHHITRWRGHHLLGSQPSPEFNAFNSHGLQCLIAFHSDDFLGTVYDHSHSMSCWFSREHLERGLFENGVYVRHQNG
ncbi:MAG: DUF1963 domain-containing protein [Pseudomonadota bacterium]